MTIELSEKILEKIKVCKDKKRINLATMQINDENIKKVMDEIIKVQPKPIIESIDLDSNALTDKGAVILADCLQHFHQLATLSLQGNKIDREGAIAIFRLMREHPDLDILFRGNKISDAGVMADIKAIAIEKSGATP